MLGVCVRERATVYSTRSLADTTRVAFGRHESSHSYGEEEQAKLKSCGWRRRL